MGEISIQIHHFTRLFWRRKHITIRNEESSSDGDEEFGGEGTPSRAAKSTRNVDKGLVMPHQIA